MTRHHDKRGFVTRKRRFHVIQPQQRIAPIDQRAGVGWNNGEHGVIARPRLGKTPQLKTGIAEIVENFGMIRRNGERMAVPQGRLFVAPDGMKRETEIRHRIRRIRIGLERGCEKAQRLDHAAALEIDHPEQMQRLEIVRLVFENAAAQPLGLLQIAIVKGAGCLPLHAGQVRYSPRCLPACRQHFVFRENMPTAIRNVARSNQPSRSEVSMFRGRAGRRFSP